MSKILEHYDDGMVLPLEKVYLVLQTQAQADYRDYPIAVYTEKCDAYKVARALNKQYGQGYKFTPDWDVDPKCDEEYDDTHYYTVGEYKLNPSKKTYGIGD